MAIARDASSLVENGNGTAVSLSHTCASGAVLVVGVRINTPSITPTSVTYNGVAMTLLNSSNDGGSTFMQHTYFLGNPTSGANNITVNVAVSQTISINGQSYTGAATTVDSNAQATGNSTTASSAVTIVNNNSWSVMFVSNANGGTSSSSTNCTKINGFSNVGAGDTNGAVGTGSLTQALTWSGSGQWVAQQVAIKPSTGAVAQPAFLINMM